MDAESFEPCALGEDVLGDSIDFLVEKETHQLLMVEGQHVAIQLPTSFVLEVADTAPVEHAGGSTDVMREAKLNCGLIVRIYIGINTETFAYFLANK